jgi:hypothetical protein
MGLVWTTRPVLAMSMARLAVAVRVWPSRMLRLPVLHSGGVTAEHLEPRERVLKAWPLRQSA